MQSKLSTLVPAQTINYLVEKLNHYLQHYVGRVCLFWDESQHYYGCWGGEDPGVVALVRKISATASGTSIYVDIETCCNSYNIDIDDFFIADNKDLTFVDDLDEDSRISYELDADGNFTDIELNPLMDVYILESIEWMGMFELMADDFVDLIKDNFLGKVCTFYDLSCKEKIGPLKLEDVKVELEGEKGEEINLCLGKESIHYTNLKITTQD